jgi:hypothetical protein
MCLDLAGNRQRQAIARDITGGSSVAGNTGDDHVHWCGDHSPSNGVVDPRHEA